MSTPLISNDLVKSVGCSAARIGAGVLAARSYGSISEYTGLQLRIGTLFDKIVPTQVKNFSEKCALKLGYPVIWLQTTLLEHGCDKIAFSKWFANVIGPTIEEAVFRLGLQKGVAFALTSIGINPTLATIISMSCQSFMFGQAHSPDLDSDQFSSTMLSGLIFGALQAYGGFHEAALAHVIFDSTL